MSGTQDRYREDVKRLHQRIELVLSSFQGAPDVHEGWLTEATKSLRTGMLQLAVAVSP